MNDTYMAKNGLSKKDAEAAASLWKDIEKSRGRLDSQEQARAFLNASRPATSATHHLFEWDDAKAAEAQRLYRAKEIIRMVYVVHEESPEQPVRAFPVLVVNGKRGPYPMRRVLESRDLASAMLEDAHAEMDRFIRRYEGLKALADVFREMRKVISAGPAKAKKAKKKAAAA